MLLFLFVDQSLRSSYLPMTILAQLRDCHSCYDECSIDQKKTYQMRYVFAYTMDDTDLPCYILWPIRTEDNSFWCLDAWKGDWVQLDRRGFMAPVGIEQFFDAFSLDPRRPWRTAACQALGIPAGHIVEDTHTNHSEGSRFTLTPRCILLSAGQLPKKAGLMCS